MIKVARKPSSDPLQEKLRQNKALWNKDISAFISDLINLKKTMNGWPSKFFQEKSFIKDPIPADPVTLLGVLSGDFQELAQKGNSIVQEQLDYSKTRRKRQVKPPPGQPSAAPTAAPEQPSAPDLSQQLETPTTASLVVDMIKVAAHFEDKYDLVSLGSNPMSRFFTRLLNPTFGPFGLTEAAKVRRVRKQLLDASATTYKKLENLQVSIVKSSKSSIQKSNEIMRDAWTDWDTVRSGFKTYKGLMPVTVADPGGELPEPKEVEEIKKKEKEDADKKLESEIIKSKKPSEDVDNKFDKINKSMEDGKPEPGDSDYEDPSEEQKPDWSGSEENLMDHLHEQQTVRLANWIKGDYQFAIRNLPVLHDNNIQLEAFKNLTESLKRFSIRNSWAPLVIEIYKELLAECNDHIDSSERSFRDLVAVLKERTATENKIFQEKKKLEVKQFKDQTKKERMDQRELLLNQRLQLQRKKDKFESDQKKIQDKEFAYQDKVNSDLEKAKQKAFLHHVKPNAAQGLAGNPANSNAFLAPVEVPVEEEAPKTDPSATPVDSGNAQDQLEVTAQAFLKKWIGKTRHQMSMFDKTSSQRLQIFDVAEEARKQIDSVMDHLEKDLNVTELEPMIDKVGNQMGTIRTLTRNLYLNNPAPKKK